MKDTIKCIIIDDEQKARENIRLLIEAYCPRLEIIGEAWDESSIQSVLGEYRPDVVFLDIQIGSDNIFDLIEEQVAHQFSVVFVTAHLDYAIEGYSFRAIDYLLKPIDTKKLVALYHHLLNQHTSAPSDKETIVEELKVLLKEKEKPQKISLADADSVHLVRIKDILYCVGEGAYTTCSLTEKRTYCVSKNLKVFEEKLKEHDFFRINKSALINLEFVKQYRKEDGGYVVMEDEAEFFVSRLNKRAFLKVLANYSIR